MFSPVLFSPSWDSAHSEGTGLAGCPMSAATKGALPEGVVVVGEEKGADSGRGPGTHTHQL